MDMASMESAKTTAMEMILEAGWTIESFEEAGMVQRSDCDEAAIAYYDQALIDKTVLVYHCRPIDAPDANEEDELSP
jgi:hypothetical protein